MRRLYLLKAFVFALIAKKVDPLAVGGGNLTGKHDRVVVVGKVIIDEYRKESTDHFHGNLSIGGGGPQAAFGAAAALAVLEGDQGGPPPQHPITFLGPVGQLDWSAREDDTLRDMLDPMVDSIHLVQGASLKTPRIQLWHDEEQNIQWRPLNDSFGPDGAGGLWRNRPSAEDVLKSLGVEQSISSLHVIIEVGHESPADGEDGKLLHDSALLQRAKVVGVEPVAFPDDATGEISQADVRTCASRLNKVSATLDFVSPDDHLYRAMDENYWGNWDVAVRNGPNGSSLSARQSKTITTLPAAKLLTSDGQPVNPTGAGNAYAAAMTTCVGAGASLLESGCIATAIGAVVCEYDHLPPWNADTLKRIRQAKDEVQRRVEVPNESLL